MATEANTGLEFWPSGAIQQDLLFNAFLRWVGAHVKVLDKDLNTPPAHTAGNAYIVGGSPTGAWAGKANYIAYSDGTSWWFYAPYEGLRLPVLDEDVDYRYSGTAWVNMGSVPVTAVNGMTGAVTLTGKDIAEPLTALTISSGVVNIDCSLGDYFTLLLTSNVTSINLNNPPASGFAQTIMVRIKQDGTGGRTLAFPTSLDWAGGTVPTISSAANAKDLLAITTFDQGTSWEATLQKANA